jgi:hypothetical protein
MVFKTDFITSTIQGDPRLTHENGFAIASFRRLWMSQPALTHLDL